MKNIVKKCDYDHEQEIPYNDEDFKRWLKTLPWKDAEQYRETAPHDWFAKHELDDKGQEMYEHFFHHIKRNGEITQYYHLGYDSVTYDGYRYWFTVETLNRCDADQHYGEDQQITRLYDFSRPLHQFEISDWIAEKKGIPPKFIASIGFDMPKAKLLESDEIGDVWIPRSQISHEKKLEANIYFRSCYKDRNDE